MRVHAAKTFADVAQLENGVQNSRICFMLSAHVYVCWDFGPPLGLLEFCLSIFVLSCSILSEVRQCRM